MYRIAIVEDDEKTQQTDIEFLKKFGKEKGVIFDIKCYSNGAAFLFSFLEENVSFDILLLDIDLPGINGIDLAKKIREVNQFVIIIFTTLLSQFVFRGYEVDALDYLIKPISYVNLSVKIEKALGKLKNKSKTLEFLSNDKKMYIISVDDIMSIESFNHYCMFKTTKGEFKKYVTLSSVEKELSKYGFLRCSYSCLVNSRYIESVSNENVIVGGTVLQISRRKKKQFMDELSALL